MGEFREPSFQGFEARLDLGCSDPQRRCPLISRNRFSIARIAEQALSSSGIGGHPVGLEERQGVPGRETMAGRRRPEAGLRAALERAERASHGEPKSSVVEQCLQLRVELSEEKETPRYPGCLSSEELRDGGDAEAILVEERGDDVSLVHGTHAAPGRVRGEHRCLHRAARDRLDHDRDLGLPLAPPASETLEAVDDLVVPGVDFRDPDR